ncbi:MAG: sodium:solute symporter family protein [Ignavibacteriae bacterium]|nr:MAG: sodium:solute symporter family protein [Ignavibacteriota bacterium]
MNVHFSLSDIALIVAYFLAVLFIGFRAARRRKSGADDFLLAGRTLTLPVFVATLVSTWYGGILGVGEFSYTYGISNWVVFGIPYYLFALVFALFLAKKVRATNLVTLPDKLEQAYDKRTALAGGILTFVLVTPAAYVLMLGILARLIFGIDLTLSIVAATFLTVVYLYKGGFRSDVWANVFEFVMMFLGFALIVIFSYSKFGGWDFIRTHVPPLHLTWHGGNSLQFVTVWFFIALWTLVDPAFHQRCYAAKDGRTAQRGILVSILFWLVFDFMTSIAGLYARASLPHLPQPMYSYPLLAELTLPAVAKGMFYIGMLATIMSTLSSLTLISAITVGKDIVGRWKNAADDSELVQRWTKGGLVLSALFSIVLAISVPSVVKIWYTIGTCVIPGLLVPVLASYFDRFKISTVYAYRAMMSGWFFSTASLVTGYIYTSHGNPSYWYGVEPMYPGLFMALFWWGMGKLETTKIKNPIT